MVFMNHKEGTGIRARGDLSPNQRVVVDTSAPLTLEQLVTAAQYLNGLANQSRECGSHWVEIPLGGALRSVDALLTAGQPGTPTS